MNNNIKRRLNSITGIINTQNQKIERININTQKQNIQIINNYLENISPDEKLEMINKIKKYYQRYINQRQITNNKIMNSINNIKRNYNSNSSVNKTLTIMPRSNQAYLAFIYKQEVNEIIFYLLNNITDQAIFPNFESIIFYTAKKRRMIEYYKLNIVPEEGNTKHYVFFGKLRADTNLDKYDSLLSPVTGSNGKHLIPYILENIGQYPIRYKNYDLTYFITTWEPNEEDEDGFQEILLWKHTLNNQIYNLLKEMNKLFDKFKIIYSQSLSNKGKKIVAESIFAELYWLYMQTCPFARGSASIGEIVFSVLLQIYFKCDFRLFKEEYNPHIIPDIHALTYPLKIFIPFFWNNLVTCYSS
jgi:hypothetical protein